MRAVLEFYFQFLQGKRFVNENVNFAEIGPKMEK